MGISYSGQTITENASGETKSRTIHTNQVSMLPALISIAAGVCLTSATLWYFRTSPSRSLLSELKKHNAVMIHDDVMGESARKFVRELSSLDLNRDINLFLHTHGMLFISLFVTK